MAILTILVPNEAGAALSQVDVPGDLESPEDYHITMLYLGKEVPTEDLAKALVVTHDVVKSVKPFRVRVESVSSFPKGDDGMPIICPVVSPEIHALRDKLVRAFDVAGVHYDNKFPEFKPHVTLAYDKEGESFHDRPVKPVEWVAKEIVLWGGDDKGEGLTMTIPFDTNDKTALYRNVIKLSHSYQQRPGDAFTVKLFDAASYLSGFKKVLDNFGFDDWVRKIQSTIVSNRRNLTTEEALRESRLLEDIRKHFKVETAEELEGKFLSIIDKEIKSHVTKEWAVEEKRMFSSDPKSLVVTLRHTTNTDGYLIECTIKYNPWKVKYRSDTAEMYIEYRISGKPGKGGVLLRKKHKDVKYLQRLAEDVIDRFLRAKRKEGPAVQISDERSSAPTQPSPKDNKELLGKLKKLEEAAAAKGDKWTTDFAKSLYTQVSRGKTLSDKQNLYMERGFKRYKVAGRSMAQRIVARFLSA